MSGRTTIWLPVRPDHPILAAAGFTEVSQVPVFLDGEAFLRWQERRSVEVSPRGLLFGAMLHADGEAPVVDSRSFLAHLPAMLDVLARGFGADSTEGLVVDVAATMREQHGSALSRRALRGVIKAFPSFHLARCDLLIDTWMEALDAGERERRQLLVEVLDALSGLDRSRLAAGPRAVACYATVAATAVVEGLDQARRQLDALGPELDAGDEGELRLKLECFLASGGTGWAGLRFTVS